MAKTTEPMSDADFEAMREKLAAETARRQKAAAEEALAPLQGLIDLADPKAKRNLEDTLTLAREQTVEGAVVQQRTIWPHLDAFVRAGELLQSAIKAAEQSARATPAPGAAPVPPPAA